MALPAVFRLLKFDLSIWLFLVIGIALRCVALNQPLADAHLIRQCMTAAATKSMSSQSGLPLSADIPWLGDLDLHYTQEFPVYNYCVIALYRLGVNFDSAGKLVSILFWAISFLLLQAIWRRLLDKHQTLWANLLFVISPLEIFFGQAFMPEMLTQAVAFGFVLLILRYNERPTLIGWWMCVATGLAALLVKLPETAHLYLIPGILLVRREGWRHLLKPRYLIGAIVTIAALKTWGHYVDSVNTHPLSFGSSAQNLKMFIGTVSSRLDPRPWLMVILYVVVFLAPFTAALVSLWGLRLAISTPCYRLLRVWLIAMVAFYFLWLPHGPGNQSYYNLPTAAPLCALFGIGAVGLLSLRAIVWRTGISIALVLSVAPPAVIACRYLFTQDREILNAARWLRENTAKTDMILVRLTHRPDMADLSNNPVVAYHSGRHTFVLTASTPEDLRRIAIQRSNVAIITLPGSERPGVVGAIDRFRGKVPRQPDSMDWLAINGFLKIDERPGFAAFRKRANSNP
jgi:hypothetical protein